MTVADEKGRRWDASTGIAAAVLMAVGFFLPGTPPKADDTAAQITTFLVDKRSEILTGDFLVGLGAVAFIWFLGSLRSYLRSAEGGAGRLSAAAFGGGIAGTAVLIAAISLLTTGAFAVAELGDDTVNRALYDASAFLGIAAGFAFAVLLGAASCSAARSGALPRWLVWLGSLGAVAQLVSTVGMFAKSGFFAVGGEFLFVGFFLALIWIIAVSVVMIRSDGVPVAPTNS